MSEYNISLLEKNVNSILEFISLLKLEKKTDLFQIEMEVMNAFPEFYEGHPFLVKTLCKGSDLTILSRMINELKQVETGEKTLTQVEGTLGSELADEYLYPCLEKPTKKRKLN
jgi:citrate lyase synthetase